jgi:cell division protein FtsI/penicillin-binding protein 2
MTGTIATVVGKLATNRTAWRRARNLRSGATGKAVQPAQEAVAIRPRLQKPGAAFWTGLAGIVLAVAGAFVIVTHARTLAETAREVEPDAANAQLAPFEHVLPGGFFTVPATPGVTVQAAGAGTVLVLAGMRPAPPVHVDLCAQMLDPKRPRLLPVRIGYRFADVAGLVARGAAQGLLRNVVLASPGSAMPQVLIDGIALPDFASEKSQPLRVRWQGDARWIAAGADSTQAQQGTLRREGWLVWHGDAALRVIRRPSAVCPQAGELVLQLYRTQPAARTRALVLAMPRQGGTVVGWFAPGGYRVPSTGSTTLEDEALFAQLQARGLVRLGASGLVELAPPDLAAYLAAPAAARGAALDGWERVRLDDTGRKLIERLYRKADGDYVREQVRIFNAERRLLAWRVQGVGPAAGWQAAAGGVPLATTGAMPAASARLFAQLPQGWEPWLRVADWPPSGRDATLTLALPRPAAGGENLTLMLAGRVTRIAGARLRAAQDACTGRACPGPGAVRELALELLPGAAGVQLTVAPLDMAALMLPADQQYRHLQLDGDRLAWQALPGRAAAPRTPAATVVSLADRNGIALWGDGAPTEPASRAGLAALLGVRAGHDSSIAGMLARLPGDGTHAAQLTLDLPLQAASQAALECIGLHRGRYENGSCQGPAPAPAGRQAGLVVIDTETGDVLAAAGAGGIQVTPANWNEVRDFDRADPARSPLRLPALQHDGGANRSPGSTFKVISALGLELAARRDRGLDALLGGLSLTAINRLAQDKGFGFRTDAAAYPANSKAHITNFRDQHLDRRAVDGRLGLQQALTYSLNTWFAWTSELSDRSLFGRAEGGAPDLQPLEAGALAGVRPIVEMADRLGFGHPLRLDGGLLPPDYPWSAWDALQGTPAHIDPIHTRHELRQMAIGLRMQATPLQMALAAGAVGQGHVVVPRLLLALDGRRAALAPGPMLDVRLDRIRAGMKGVVDVGTAAGAFRGREFDSLRPGLFGKTGTAPTGAQDAAGRDLSTVWFTGWLEPDSIPGQAHRLAVAAFVSHSEATGGEHAAPIVAEVLRTMLLQNRESKSPPRQAARQ